MKAEFSPRLRPTVALGLRFPKLLALVLLLLAFGGSERSLAVLWGNTYQVNGAGSAIVSPTNTHWVTFTATEDMQVSAARFNANSVTGAPLVTVSLRGVNGSGVPTGPVLGSGTVSPVGGGWHGVTLSGTGVALSSGVIYAMEVATATASTSLAWRFNGGPTGGIQPYGDPDPDFLRGANAGAPVAGSNVFILETDIGRSVGQPYVSSPAVNLALTTTTQAQRFKFDLAGAGGNSVVESVQVRLSIGATAPSSDVTLKLISSTGTVLASSTRNLSGEAAGSSDFTFDLNTNVSLTDDANYYIGMYSNGSAGNSVNWFGWDATNSAEYISASFQGADANGVLFGSQSVYTGAPTETVNRDYAFGLNLIPEPSSLLLLIGGGTLLLAVRRRRALA